jgi:hypothetical protein
VFPNPFDNFIEISTSENIERIEITNLLGNTVIETSIASQRINTSGLSPGIYLVYFYGENGKKSVQKMIRN